MARRRLGVRGEWRRAAASRASRGTMLNMWKVREL
ncbi:rCG36405, partial [Rattus norvegicus]